MERIANFIKSINPSVTKESIEKMNSIATLREYKKGEIVETIGEQSENFYFILSGLVRKYTLDDKGKERIKGFYKEFNIISPFSSLFTNKENQEPIDCLKETILVSFNYKEYKKLCSEDNELLKIYTTTLEKALIIREKRIYELTVLDATERYLQLKKDFHDIENLVAQYHIASYLNITPTQLSRIRKKLYSK